MIDIVKLTNNSCKGEWLGIHYYGWMNENTPETAILHKPRQ